MGEVKRTRYQIMVDSIVGTVAGSLVLGFFVVLWSGFEKLEKEMSDHHDFLERTNARIEASGDVLSEEVAKLRTGIRRVESLIAEKHPDAEIRVAPDIPADLPSALQIRDDVQMELRARAKGRMDH